MLFSTRLGVAVLTTLSTLPLAQTQLVASLPQCVQTCISQSGDENCSVFDVKCLCRASNGNFLPDTITCMHGNCDNDLDTNIFITPLQLACEIAGTPISNEAIQNAENEASSLASQVTTTVTSTVGGSGSASSAKTTANTGSAQSVVTLTTTASGSTVVIVYPVSIESTTTVYGSPSTTFPATISSTSSSSEITDAITKSESISSSSSPSLGSANSNSVSSTVTQITSINTQDTSSTSKSTSSKTGSSYTVPTNGDILNGDVDNVAPKEVVKSSMSLLIAIVACLVAI